MIKGKQVSDEVGTSTGSLSLVEPSATCVASVHGVAAGLGTAFLPPRRTETTPAKLNGTLLCLRCIDPQRRMSWSFTLGVFHIRLLISRAMRSSTRDYSCDRLGNIEWRDDATKSHISVRQSLATGSTYSTWRSIATALVGWVYEGASVCVPTANPKHGRMHEVEDSVRE